jgi:hypothetical protein
MASALSNVLNRKGTSLLVPDGRELAVLWQAAVSFPYQTRGRTASSMATDVKEGAPSMSEPSIAELTLPVQRRIARPGQGTIEGA